MSTWTVFKKHKAMEGENPKPIDVEMPLVVYSIEDGNDDSDVRGIVKESGKLSNTTQTTQNVAKRYSCSFVTVVLSDIIQLLTIVYVFIENDVFDPTSISNRLHANPPFVVVMGVTLILQSVLKVLEAILQPNRCLFVAVFTSMMLEMSGWFVVIMYDEAIVHLVGTTVFMLGMEFQMLALLIYHEKNSALWLWFLYAVAVITSIGFATCYAVGFVIYQHYFEWTTFTIFCLEDLLYMLVFSNGIF